MVISAAQADGSSVGRRGDLAKPTGKRGMAGLRGGTRELAMEKDPVGEVGCRACLMKAGKVGRRGRGMGGEGYVRGMNIWVKMDKNKNNRGVAI